jgi:hypothetical protein
MAVAVGAAVFCIASVAAAQQATPSQDIDEVITEDQQTPQEPVSPVDRTAYRALQDWKKGLYDKYGFTFAIENTTIYQHTTGGVDPN